MLSVLEFKEIVELQLKYHSTSGSIRNSSFPTLALPLVQPVILLIEDCSRSRPSRPSLVCREYLRIFTDCTLLVAWLGRG